MCSTWPASLQCHAGHCHVVHCITSVARAVQQRRYHTCIGRTAGDVCWQLLGRSCSLAVALPWASCKPYAHWFHATFFLTHSGMQECQPSTVSQCSEHAVAHASMHCLGRPWRRKGGAGPFPGQHAWACFAELYTRGQSCWQCSSRAWEHQRQSAAPMGKPVSAGTAPYDDPTGIGQAVPVGTSPLRFPGSSQSAVLPKTGRQKRWAPSCRSSHASRNHSQEG